MQIRIGMETGKFLAKEVVAGRLVNATIMIDFCLKAKTSTKSLIELKLFPANVVCKRKVLLLLGSCIIYGKQPMTKKVSNNSGLGDCGLMIHLFICIAKKNLYVNFLTCVHICVKVNHAVKSEKILHFTCAMILSNLPPNHSIAC